MVFFTNYLLVNKLSLLLVFKGWGCGFSVGIMLVKYIYPTEKDKVVSVKQKFPAD